MTSSALRHEWVRFNTFALATQTKLLELLTRMKEEVSFYFNFFF